MKILILRSWSYINYSATFSDTINKGVGGTEMQMLNHARILKNLGHEIIIIGTSKIDKHEESIFFKGTGDKESTKSYIKEELINIDLIFINVTEDLFFLRENYKKAFIIEICQNGPHFYNDKYIDYYMMIGEGQFAYYSTKYKKYRQKLLSVPSVPPYNSIYKNLIDIKKENQIIWVGSVTKQGFRRWAKAMTNVLEDYNNLNWVICTPSYYDIKSNLKYHLKGIKINMDKVYVKNLNIWDLAKELSLSKMLLTSLGGEDGPVSYLDGHAAGVPVLCGNDIIGKYYNMEGMGIRCTTSKDCEMAIRYILENPDIAHEMGMSGRDWIRAKFTEDHQALYMKIILSFLAIRTERKYFDIETVQSDKKFSVRYYMERILLKLLNTIN